MDKVDQQDNCAGDNQPIKVHFAGWDPSVLLSVMDVLFRVEAFNWHVIADSWETCQKQGTNNERDYFQIGHGSIDRQGQANENC